MPDNDVITEIKQRLDIADVVGQTVRLTRAGRNLKGLCPFHSEKTPSFIVYPKDGSYHCFGCGANGDLFTFLMKTEGLDFRGALEKLASRAGVTLKPRSEHAAAEDRVRERLKEACGAASAYYYNLLRNHPAAGRTRAYAEKRGFTGATLETFQIGYAPEAWDALSTHLSGRGFTWQEMVDAGLVVEREEGGYRDRFHNRLMFPIRDPRGEVVGFGARALEEGQLPKYLNSPQTALFDKSSLLYGFDLARQAIQRTGQAIIVEGYVDVVIAHQAGQNNVVGTIGTALTDRHAELLKRLAKRIILCLDPDTAGDLAALKGSEVLQEHAERIVVPIRGERGMLGIERRSQIEIRIMQLPRGVDPDELLLSEGGHKQWAELRESALPLVDHVLGLVAAKHDITTARGKSEAVREVAAFIREIGDPVQRAHYEQRIAAMLRVPEEAVQEAVGRTRGTSRGRSPASYGRERESRGGYAGASPPGRAGLPEPADPNVGPEEHLLALVLSSPQVTWMAGAPSPEDFLRLENRLIFEAVATAAAGAGPANLDAELVRRAARDDLDPALAPYFDRLAAREEPELTRYSLPSQVEARLRRLRQHNDRMWVEQCRYMLDEARETGDVETASKLLPILSTSVPQLRDYNPKPSAVFRDSRD